MRGFLATTLVLASVIAATSPAGTQVAAPVVTIAPGEVAVPVEREPQHHLVYTNATISVLDVRFPPGYASRFHVHTNDNVSVRIDTGPTRTDLVGAEPAFTTAAVGRVVFNLASPPYTHRVVNLGTTPIRILDVELLLRAAPTPTPASAPDQMAGHEVAVENDRVRISRLKFAAGADRPAHTHAHGWLEVIVKGQEPGAFLWHNAGSVAVSGGADASEREIVEVEVK